MKEYMKNHENYILNLIRSETHDPADILKYHQKQIRWIQHERLIHLLVMCLTIILFLFACVILYILRTSASLILWVILLLLNLFYIYHYYFLENTLQKWYKIANLLQKKSTGLATNVYNDN